jgi:hypothetical protein
MKFSHKLSFIIFITGLTVLIILSTTIYKLNYDSVIVSQSRFTQSIAKEVSDDIDHMLSEKIKTTLTLANNNTIIQALEESITSYADMTTEKREESIKQSPTSCIARGMMKPPRRGHCVRKAPQGLSKSLIF